MFEVEESKMGKVSKAKESGDDLRKVQTPNKRSAKDQNAPKRARSAYIFFTTAVTKKIREANPGWSQTDIMREAANRWKEARDPDASRSSRRLAPI